MNAEEQPRSPTLNVASTWELEDGSDHSIANQEYSLTLTCFNTKHPTALPTSLPTERPSLAPTLAPTMICGEITVTGTMNAAFDGKYAKQSTLVNELPFWKSRSDIVGDAELMFYEGLRGQRWKLQTAGSSYYGPVVVSGEDYRMPPGIAGLEHVYPAANWERFEDMVDGASQTFAIRFSCTDTAVPTMAPSVSPTVSPTRVPTDGPTPQCGAITIYGSSCDGESYNGVYNKMTYTQTGSRDARTYWVARNDVGGVIDSNLDAKLYYYEGVYGNRWALEGPTCTFFAPKPTNEDKAKMPSGVSDYFGSGTWFRVTRHENVIEDYLQEVTLELVCSDTKFPTALPSKAPTEHPSRAPTLHPTATCTTVRVAGTIYNGLYRRQSNSINNHDWWKARNDVPTIGSGLNIRMFFYIRDEAQYWKIEGPNGSYLASADHKTIRNVIGDDRRPHGLDDYYGQSAWTFNQPTAETREENSALDSTQVNVELICYDEEFETMKPTLQPTEAPTMAPTNAPTQTCASLTVTGAGADFNGQYNKQPNPVNNYAWWKAREDVDDASAKIYFYTGINGNRWKIEGTDISYYSAEAVSIGRRGDSDTPSEIGTWEHFKNDFASAQTAGASQFMITVVCDDTRMPTVLPTLVPTEHPTRIPTQHPTEICGSLEVSGSTEFNGFYTKSVCGTSDCWRSRNDVNDNKPVKLYLYSGSFTTNAGSRWKLEGESTSYYAREQTLSTGDAIRVWEASGDDWEQVGKDLIAHSGDQFTVNIKCTDTAHPTEVPTLSPTALPTELPTKAPTEACVAVEITIDGSSAGVYVKESAKLNFHDNWTARDGSDARLFFYEGVMRENRTLEDRVRWT